MHIYTCFLSQYQLVCCLAMIIFHYSFFLSKITGKDAAMITSLPLEAEFYVFCKMIKNKALSFLKLSSLSPNFTYIFELCFLLIMFELVHLICSLHFLLDVQFALEGGFNGVQEFQGPRAHYIVISLQSPTSWILYNSNF